MWWRTRAQVAEAERRHVEWMGVEDVGDEARWCRSRSVVVEEDPGGTPTA